MADELGCRCRRLLRADLEPIYFGQCCQPHRLRNASRLQPSSLSTLAKTQSWRRGLAATLSLLHVPVFVPRRKCTNNGPNCSGSVPMANAHRPSRVRITNLRISTAAAIEPARCRWLTRSSVLSPHSRSEQYRAAAAQRAECVRPTVMSVFIQRTPWSWVRSQMHARKCTAYPTRCERCASVPPVQHQGARHGSAKPQATKPLSH